MAKTGKCKFIVDSITDYGDRREVKLSPTYNNENPEDNSFYNGTINSGDMRFLITDKKEFNFFKPKECYFIEVTPCKPISNNF